MICCFCKKEYENGFTLHGLKGNYCSEHCLVEWNNKFRLGFLPRASYNPGVIELDQELTNGNTIKNNSASAIQNFLIKDLPLDELVLFIQLCQQAVNDTSLLVHKQRKHEQDYEFQKIRDEIRGQVSARDSTLVKGTVEQREKAEKQKAVRATGEKLSKDGKCIICDAPSTALTCSKKCKENNLMIQSFLKIGKSMDEAKDILKKMGRLQYATPS